MRAAFLVLCLSASLVACDRGPAALECAGEGSGADDAARASLIGVWVAEVDDPDTPMTLRLEIDEMSVRVSSGGPAHEAPWRGCAGDGYVSMLVEHEGAPTVARARVDGDRLQIAPLYDVVFERMTEPGQTP